MEIEGKVILILPEQSGVKKDGNQWKAQSFIIETIENYPRKVCIDLFGEDRIKNNPFAIDDHVNVSYDLESREFNGRWYTSVRAWKVEKVQAQQPQPASDPFAAGGTTLPGESTDLFGELPQGTTDPFGAQ